MKQFVTSKAARQVLVAQKNSPHILFAGGVVGVVATVVLASRGTLKLEGILEAAEQDRKTANDLAASGHPAYTEKDCVRDKTIIMARTAFQITKLYAPAFVVGAASVAALTGSHVILNRRNIALTAAYNTVAKSFEQYRRRVLAEVGPEKEREFRYGVEEREIYSEGKKGEPKVTRVKNAAGPSMYAKFFDRRSDCFSDEPDYNIMFLRAQQTWANQKLRTQGHLLLNDVYDKLGLERTPEGAIVGWTYEGDGDGFVSFGVLDGERPDEFVDFMTGREESLLLDFNVEGVVYDKIGKPKGRKK